MSPTVGHVQKARSTGRCRRRVDCMPRQHPATFAKVDVAHQAALKRAFDVQLLHGAMLDHGHTGFLG